MNGISRRQLVMAMGTLACAALPAARVFAQAKIKPDAHSVLIVVDVQNCFMPGGSLAVKQGDEVVPIINKLAQSFQNVVITQDWHHPQHVSFASSTPARNRLNKSSSRTASRCYGPIIACKAPRARRCTRTCRYPTRSW